MYKKPTKTGLRKAELEKVQTLARKEGYRLGLRMFYALVRKAKSRQAVLAKSMPDVHAELEHCASVLHALGLKMQEEIKKAGA